MVNVVNFFYEEVILSLLHQGTLRMLFKHIEIQNKSIM